MQMLQRPMPMLGISFDVLSNGSLSSLLWGMPEMSEDSGYAMAPGSTAELKYSAINGSIQARALDSMAKSGDYRIIIMSSNGVAAYESSNNATQCR